MKDAAAPSEIAGVALARIDADDDAVAPSLSRSDAPQWARDAVAISSRVRALLATLRPIVVRVHSFWEHLARSVVVANGRRLDVDPSGCYRLR